MHAIVTASGVLERINTRIGKTAAWLLVPLMLVIIVDVITRKFGILTWARESFAAAGMDGTSHFIEAYLTSTKFQEMEWHLHAALFLLCLGFGYVKNSHVRIEIIREHFDTRTKATLEILGCTLFLAPYAALVLYFGLDFAQRSYDMGEVSSALTGLTHRWIIKSFVPIGMVLLLLAGAAVALRNIAYLMDPRGESGAVYDIALELHNPEEELRRLEEAELESIKQESVERAESDGSGSHRTGE